MTIDEAIKHYEEVAEEKESEARDLEYSKLDWRHEANQCSERAEEHRQIAEWLKDYKRLKEQEPCEDCISRKAVLNKILKFSVTDGRSVSVTELWTEVNGLAPVTPTASSETKKKIYSVDEEQNAQEQA